MHAVWVVFLLFLLVKVNFLIFLFWEKSTEDDGPFCINSYKNKYDCWILKAEWILFEVWATHLSTEATF